MGNYVNGNTDWQVQLANLEKLIQLRRKYPNVTLLIGGQDYQYIDLSTKYRCTGFQANYAAFHALFTDNRDLFQFAFQHKNYLFTHAGVSKTFLAAIRKKTGIFGNMSVFANDYNRFADTLEETFYSSLFGGGRDPFDGPLWIRPEQLLNDLPDEQMFQVVGRTQQEFIANAFLQQNIVKFAFKGDSYNEFKFIT